MHVNADVFSIVYCIDWVTGSLNGCTAQNIRCEGNLFRTPVKVFAYWSIIDESFIENNRKDAKNNH